MPATQLQHINIRCIDAEASRNFYVLLGFRQGPRPPFESMGYWLYSDEEPVVHLVQKRQGEARLGPGTGELNHVAFGGSDLDGMRELLQVKGIAFRETVVPRDGVTQLFVIDPDGVTLELNFPLGA